MIDSKFLRLFKDTVSELATARLGNEIIGVHFPKDSAILFATTEKKLFKLNRDDLTIIEKWDRGVPNSAYEMHLTASGLVMAQGERLAVFDLETAKSRKISAGAKTSLFEDGPDLLVYSAEAGQLWNLGSLQSSKKLVAETFECRGCSIDQPRRTLWLYGARHAWAKSHPELLKRVGRVCLSPQPECEEFLADIHVGAVVSSGDSLLVIEIREEIRPGKSWQEWVPTNIHAIKLHDFEPASNWSLPISPDSAHLIPSLAAIVTTSPEGDRTLLRCFALPGQSPSQSGSSSFRVDWD